MKKILFLALLFSILPITFYSEPISFFFAKSVGLNWFHAFLSPRLFAIIIASIAGFVSLSFSSKTWKKSLSFGLSFLGIIGFYSIINPPYIEDFSKYGEVILDKQFAENGILKQLTQANPNYEGLVSLVMVDCPYCKESTRKISVIAQRAKNLDFSIFLYSNSEVKLKAYSQETNPKGIQLYLTPDEESTLELCGRDFPTFFYIKKGQIIHKWNNREFGYPALAWVENQLID